MKAYKIQVDPYEIIVSENGKEETKNLYMKFELPRILCNPNLGLDKDSKPSKDFDLMELGPIAQKIEQCKEVLLTVSEFELKVLKKRVEVVSKYFGYAQYEMFRRINEAQSVDVVEK